MDSLDKFIERYPTYIGELERLKQQIAEKDEELKRLNLEFQNMLILQYKDFKRIIDQRIKELEGE